MARFFSITQDVSVQDWLEFIGEKAKNLVAKLIELPFEILTKDVTVENLNDVLWVKPLLLKVNIYERQLEVYLEPKNPNRVDRNGRQLDETARVYLLVASSPHASGVLVNAESREVTFLQIGLNRGDFTGVTGFSEDFSKLQFRRENGARMVHYRPSDENPFLGGFSRPNPHIISDKFPDGRKCHQDFSETFVDRKPGAVFTNWGGEANQVWEDFKPVYLKVKPADGRGEYYLKVRTDWYNDEISVMTEVNPADVPEELKNFEFGMSSNEHSEKRSQRLGEVAKNAVRWKKR